MSTNVKIIICTILAAIALTLAAFTFTSFDEPQTAALAAEFAETRYVLGEWEGKIAVFREGDMGAPLQITGIELSSLREADRALIREGLIAVTETELLQLLEDLGS